MIEWDNIYIHEPFFLYSERLPSYSHTPEIPFLIVWPTYFIINEAQSSNGPSTRVPCPFIWYISAAWIFETQAFYYHLKRKILPAGWRLYNVTLTSMLRQDVYKTSH